MVIRTRRWNDPVEEGDGLRVLVCRYRPRALRKEFETWEVWYPELGPSAELHAAAYGKKGLKIGWEIYRRKYLQEMKGAEAQERIRELAKRVARGETVTLLCSSACERESRCHRSLLAELIEAALPGATPTEMPHE